MTFMCVRRAPSMIRSPGHGRAPRGPALEKPPRRLGRGAGTGPWTASFDGRTLRVGTRRAPGHWIYDGLSSTFTPSGPRAGRGNHPSRGGRGLLRARQRSARAFPMHGLRTRRRRTVYAPRRNRLRSSGEDRSAGFGCYGESRRALRELLRKLTAITFRDAAAFQALGLALLVAPVLPDAEAVSHSPRLQPMRVPCPASLGRRDAAVS